MRPCPEARSALSPDVLAWPWKPISVPAGAHERGYVPPQKWQRTRPPRAASVSSQPEVGVVGFVDFVGAHEMRDPEGGDGNGMGLGLIGMGMGRGWA